MATARSDLAGVGSAPSLHAMSSLGIMLKPIPGGWVIELTDGREIARFTGLAAKRRALRYLASHNILMEAGLGNRSRVP
jgi:hypothetical protein